MSVGSSPRVRGTLHAGQHGPRPVRFIPACAGNITNPQRKASPPTVHPRVCGEHDAQQDLELFVHGSSPRVRGTCPRGIPPRGRHRFIPACAGNIDKSIRTMTRLAVHPRVCGEHFRNVLNQDRTSGSSPRVRGTWQQPIGIVPPLRFIPACAGNILDRNCLLQFRLYDMQNRYRRFNP